VCPPLSNNSSESRFTCAENASFLHCLLKFAKILDHNYDQSKNSSLDKLYLFQIYMKLLPKGGNSTLAKDK
jgi:hypothetical protein